ncbi:gamma-butyrobetaine dioxygenase-like [Ptychodera flava]|uniref:gamma-butyrobetaine dioxygenase-like n=1 Tax=Ptychodera flava TaxID=63121 RepID=UPI003969BBE1
MTTFMPRLWSLSSGRFHRQLQLRLQLWHKGLMTSSTTWQNQKQVCRQAPAVCQRSVPLVVFRRQLASQTVQSHVEVTSPIQQTWKEDPQRMLRVKFRDGSENRYPYIWLRDNCFCPSCFLAGTKQRLITMNHLDVNVTPDSISLSKDGELLTLIWPDGHRTEFKSGFLKGILFEERRVSENRHLWGSEILQNVPTFQFQHILDSDKALLGFMTELKNTGMLLVQNVPTEMGQLMKVAERVGFIRVTNYGPVYSIKSKFDATTIGFTGHALNLHTDLSCYVYKPSIQLLHCIKQHRGEGGDSVFSDGFKAVEQLKENDPESFNILSTTVVDFLDYGTDFIKCILKASHTIIKLDQFGETSMVTYADFCRNVHMNMSPEKVYTFYKALKAFYDILNSPENIIKFKLQPGEMIVVDNTRVLHGRTAFTVEAGEERHLEGGYLDWDLVNARIRLLKQRFPSGRLVDERENEQIDIV